MHCCFNSVKGPKKKFDAKLTIQAVDVIYMHKPHCHIEGDVKVGFITARIIFNITNGGHLQNIPLN